MASALVGHYRAVLIQRAGPVSASPNDLAFPITYFPYPRMSESRGTSRDLRGLAFAKMTGSGNDFVFFDGRESDVQHVMQPDAIVAICNRHNGIGADGVVVLEPSAPLTAAPSQSGFDATIHYFNSDGSSADLCGNATLCSTVMAALLGFGAPEGMTLATPAGLIRSRLSHMLPEIDLQPVSTVLTDIDVAPASGESRIGFAVAGIPHLVVLTTDAEQIDVAARGPMLRWHERAGATGANVNWVSAMPDGRWRYRTFERGVEGETLACGTGAVATAILLTAWGLASSPVTIRTSSGRDLVVHLTHRDHQWLPTLRGEGRVVFRGRIGDLNL